MGLTVEVVELLDEMPRTRFCAHVSMQLSRSVTSAGANYEEARHSESRADFVHKVGVAAKEMAESLYWLRVIERLKTTKTTPPSNEADELLRILVASARTARRRL